ncbi:hypothetical protein ACWT_0644 [Actinoplanes sp. SE50]|nr:MULTISPECIES: hypothetical protein [unclassified Actinoplanes]AEV81658.1 hypothetical protein ACPL_761 [Actinoplanes sp. SE50/110]ATO80059.1 hypothetical protein ACWT_0644 [Actinoplanes sp. SE50]SLL97463.1 hypothetical protein ACSP50_0667 [Actinoplanes sp. SE50/110]
MSAKKMIRYASMALVLVALVGGVATSAVGHVASDSSAVQFSTLDYSWN